MAAHRIRLAGPWRLISLGSENSPRAPSETIVQLPVWRDQVRFSGSSESVELQRTFNKPSNLVIDQVLRLMFSGLVPNAKVVLNGHALDRPIADKDSKAGSVVFEIGRFLLPHNELRIAIAKPAEGIGDQEPLLDSVFLEIEPAP